MDPLSHPEDASGPAGHHWGSVGPAPTGRAQEPQRRRKGLQGQP